LELVIQHWLVSVVRAAGLPGSDALSVDSQTDTAEAWNRVAKVAGAPEKLANVVAKHFRLPVADLARANLHARLLVPALVARRLNVLPLSYSDRLLTVATADPVSLDSERELAHVSGRSVQNEVAPPQRIQQAIAAAYPELAAAETEVSKQQKGKRHILVVEDDPQTRLLIRTALQKSGYRVTEVADGKSAIARLGAEDGNFDLASLDLQLPDMNGFQVLQTLRDQLRTAMLPVIIATGTDDPKVQKQLFDAGADDFIVKPVDPARYVKRVEAVLHRRNPSLGAGASWSDRSA
jgi:CheY-like chemotaxis protein